MTAPTLLLPNTDLVAVEWAKRNPKFSAKGISVATTIPDDTAQLRRGLLQAVVVGGSPDIYSQMRSPVVAFSAWAAPAEGSENRLPWPQAFQIAEWVWEMTHDPAHRNVELTFRLPGYQKAGVHTAVALSEPRRVPTDEGFARVDLDVQLNWNGV